LSWGRTPVPSRPESSRPDHRYFLPATGYVNVFGPNGSEQRGWLSANEDDDLDAVLRPFEVLTESGRGSLVLEPTTCITTGALPHAHRPVCVPPAQGQRLAPVWPETESQAGTASDPGLEQKLAKTRQPLDPGLVRA
jgi:hypothetical protein